jgi:sugar (pentulose or hexulose) kinase
MKKWCLGVLVASIPLTTFADFVGRVVGVSDGDTITVLTQNNQSYKVRLANIDAPEMGLYAHRIGGGWLLGGASNTGGGVLKRFFTEQELTALSEKIDPSVESSLDYYPLLKPGERFPVNDPTLAPRLDPRPADDATFLHGLLESIARIERQAYDIMASLGADYPETVITAGGGAKNEAWTAIRGRVLGVPIMAAKTPEAAVGVARLVQSF